MRDRSVAVAVACALALGAAGCGSTSRGLYPGAPLRIGYLSSLTGYCAAYARQYVQGARLAVRTIDARGGVLGHRLELVVRDDRDDVHFGIVRAQQLVFSDHVEYLAGTCSGEVAKSVARLVADPNHVLYVTGAADPGVVAGGPQGYAFDTIPTATIEALGAAAYARAHPRWKRIAVIAEDYSYGYEVTAAFRRALASDQPGDEGQADQGRRERGVLRTRATEDAEMRRPSSSGQTVLEPIYVPSGGSDYVPYIERLLAERPDAVYSTVITGDAVTLVRQALPLGLFAKTRFFGTMDYGTLAAMARPPVGVEGYTYYPSAAIYRTPFARELESLGTAVANGGAAGDGFNQIEVIAQGIEKAGSVDPTRVRDALAGATVQTVQGPVRVSRCDHELATPIAMGPVAGPTEAQPFAHLAPLTLVGTGKYIGC